MTDGFEWFWTGCLYKIILLMLTFLKAQFLVFLVFLICINVLLDEVTCNADTYADNPSLYSKRDWDFDLRQQPELVSELESYLQDTVEELR